MSEKKFRALCEKPGTDTRFYYYFSIGQIIPSEYSVIEWEQFTGQIDSRNREIYEGDILRNYKYPEESPCPYSVEFDNGAFRQTHINIDITNTPILTKQEISLLDDIVIGNRLENPEMLTISYWAEHEDK